MIDPARRTVIARGAAFADLIAAHAQVFALDKWIVFAVAAQESAFQPGAIRFEAGFWRRYGTAVMRNIAASVTRADDRLAARFPELMCASIGLMQVLVPVALEVGMELEYPTDLCVPTLGIEAGCRVLRRCFNQPVPLTMLADIPVREPIVSALLAYNGGGRPAYAVEVLHWRDDAMTTGVEGW